MGLDDLFENGRDIVVLRFWALSFNTFVDTGRDFVLYWRFSWGVFPSSKFFPKKPWVVCTPRQGGSGAE